MSKPRLIRVGWTDFNSSYLEWILSQQYTLENYNLNETYSKDCTFVVSRREYWTNNLTEQCIANGNKIILANPWETQPFFDSNQFESILNNVLVVVGCSGSHLTGWEHILNIPRWFWYNESLWYTCEARMQYQNYIPNRTNNKLFFMPINRHREFRTAIVERLDEFLDNAIWSYAGRWNNGYHLKVRDVNPVAKLAWDRQFEEEWYNDTYFSIAVETSVGSTPGAPCDLFVTEKTFKPIAFQHPFMVFAMKGTLEFLHINGFETYDHIFDESYDQLDFSENRLDIIYNNIKNFDTSKYQDPLTEQKIKHNYNRFYNRQLVLDGVTKDLIEPMLEWINA